jgi:AspT/YidE/YbjL antiporter-like protein
VQLPSGLTFRLGFAGGPLIMGMILGWRHRSGPLVWSLPYTVNMALRQFGLVLFLAVIGLTAGHGFARTFAEGGWGVIAAGMGVTTLVASAGILICYRVLKMPMPVVMGMVAGVATQPACRAFAQRQADSEAPLEGYSAVYPADDRQDHRGATAGDVPDADLARTGQCRRGARQSSTRRPQGDVLLDAAYNPRGLFPAAAPRPAPGAPVPGPPHPSARRRGDA